MNQGSFSSLLVLESADQVLNIFGENMVVCLNKMTSTM